MSMNQNQIDAMGAQIALSAAKSAAIPPAAQPEQEPVAEIAGVAYVDDLDLWHFYPMRETVNFPTGTKFYTTPPKRPWVELTDEEIKTMDAGTTSNSSFYAGALWAEAKLKEKNT